MCTSVGLTTPCPELKAEMHRTWGTFPQQILTWQILHCDWSVHCVTAVNVALVLRTHKLKTSLEAVVRRIVTTWPDVATNKLYAGVNSNIKAWGGSDICTATRLRAHPNLWRFPSNKILYHSGNIIHKPSVHCWYCQRARKGRGKQRR